MAGRSRTLLLAGCLLLAACGTAADGSTSGPDVSGEWELAEGTADGAALPQPAGSGATLLLADGQGSGVSFCNHYSATFRQDGDAVVFDGLGGTEMGCEPAVMAAETAYLQALGAVDTAAVDGGTLVLTGDGIRLRFSPVAPVPDSPLEGTRWVLDTLILGDTASSTLGETAVLLLDPDRTAAASTGCRSITGTWLVENGALVIDDLLADGGQCPADVRSQDDQVTAVLAAGPRVEIREDRLTLTGDDGLGLSYRAAG